MKKYDILIICMFILVVPLNILSVSAKTVEFESDISKENYTLNETVSVQLTIETFDQEFKGFFVISIKAPEISPSSFEDYLKEIDLAKFDRDSFLYTIPIDENKPNGKYNLIFRLINETGKEISNKNISFWVYDIKELFSFEIKTCKNPSCTEKSKIFRQNQEIYLNYESEIENPIISATLIYPDGKTKEVKLPTSIKASQIGTYELEVTASKESYKTITKKEQFGVIEKEADIQTKSPSESILQDSSYQEKTSRGKLIILIISVLLVLTLIIFFVLIKNKKLRKDKKV